MSPRSRRLFSIARSIVFDRSEGRCERCGLGLPREWECHHRRLRSQGGDDSVTNLVALHMECHNPGVPGSVHSRPGIAYQTGFLVSAYADPRTTPLLLRRTQWVLLTPDGDYQPTTDPSEDET